MPQKILQEPGKAMYTKKDGKEEDYVSSLYI